MLYVVKFIQIIYMVLYVQRVVSWQPYTLDQIAGFFAEASWPWSPCYDCTIWQQKVWIKSDFHQNRLHSSAELHYLALTDASNHGNK